MIVTVRWLSLFIPELQYSSQEIAEQLTAIGHEAVALDDARIEIETAPNRGDVQSVLGIARDLAGHDSRLSFTLEHQHTLDLPAPSELLPFEISNNARSFVQNDYLLLINNCPAQPSPEIITSALKSVGLQSKNLVVDITNMVSHGLGVPLHAFDFDTVKDGLQIDLSNSEDITLLNNQQIHLEPGVLIQRSNGVAVDLVGIMGGHETSVTDKTTSILLQAATFDRQRIRYGVQTSGVKTDASKRYERGVDPEAMQFALGRAAYWLKKHCPECEVVGLQRYETSREQQHVAIDQKKISKLLGTQVTNKEVDQLTTIGFKITANEVNIPSWRTDISNWHDVADEVIKYIGTDSIQPLELNTENSRESFLKSIQKLKEYLSTQAGHQNLGITETSTYSFADRGEVTIENPRTPHQRYLRTTLQNGLLATAAQNPYIRRMAYYEIGTVFVPEERTMLGILYVGSKPQNTMFMVNNLELVELAPVDSSLLELHKIKQSNVFFGEVALTHELLEKLEPAFQQLHPATFLHQIRPISKFPPVSRDITIVMNEQNVVDVLKEFRSDSSTIIAEVSDRFEGNGTFSEGKTAITFRLLFQHNERSLTDKETDEIIDRHLSNLKKEVEFDIR